MMSRRARFLLLAVLLLLAGLLAIFLASRLQPYTETIDLGPSPEARRNPYLAAELFLRKQGVTVSRADGLEVLKELPPSGHTLLLLGSRSGMTPGQARRLLQWSEQGGHLVLIAERLWDEDEKKSGDLLLDSLVLDLAQAAREHQQQRQRLEHLQDLASEVAALGAAEHAELLQRAAACQADSDPQQLAELTERCNAILTAHLQQQAALARRQAVLQGLASLGYEVREGMATAWAQTGRVVLRKPATPGYGLEVGGKADNGRLQLRAVALNANRDSQRDRDIETLWCGEFQRLQALLAAQGGELSVERALGVG
ncbi:DUF4350 domain-containing protein, partial [Pseudomonas aeruginosa]|uniref:DUF4350 domain-containing protein n=1 Tax=Pseudomonas aeruginosa TaxID=287 RepID=UPI001E4C3D44